MFFPSIATFPSPPEVTGDSYALVFPFATKDGFPSPLEVTEGSY